jgi:hypothetical protein
LQARRVGHEALVAGERDLESAPMAVPLIAQATGLPQVSSLRNSRESTNTCSNISAAGSLDIFSLLRSMSFRSAPARNRLFAEVMTAPSVPGSPFSRSMQASRSSMKGLIDRVGRLVRVVERPDGDVAIELGNE